MSPSTDPHQGGDLFDMAKDGTQIPGDAGAMNLIKSVPRPGEADGEIAADDPAAMAGNARDIARSSRDVGMSGEVETGTGDILPASVESKRLHLDGNNPAHKGHERAAKHGKLNSQFDSYAAEGPGVDLAPADEERVKREGGMTDDLAEEIIADRERKE